MSNLDRYKIKHIELITRSHIMLLRLLLVLLSVVLGLQFNAMYGFFTFLFLGFSEYKRTIRSNRIKLLKEYKII